jgi:hypothetical protein
MSDLTNLERRVLGAMKRDPDSDQLPISFLARLARRAVREMCTGEAVNRRKKIPLIPLPPPPGNAKRLRALARQIEDSFDTMPEGWRRWSELTDEERAELRQKSKRGKKS